jgi:hypothetical protein
MESPNNNINRASDHSGLLKNVVSDFYHFINIREDNHKFIEHLFMERLKTEADLLKRLEDQIEELRNLSLKSCTNCGRMRPKRYHRSTQTPKINLPTTTSIVSHRHQKRSAATVNRIPVTSEISTEDETSVEERLKRLTAKVDKVSSKTTCMLQKSYQLEYNSAKLRNQVDKLSNY